jgi:hypothetical protein
MVLRASSARLLEYEVIFKKKKYREVIPDHRLDSVVLTRQVLSSLLYSAYPSIPASTASGRAQLPNTVCLMVPEPENRDTAKETRASIMTS